MITDDELATWEMFLGVGPEAVRRMVDEVRRCRAAVGEAERAAQEARGKALEEAARIADESAADWRQDAEHFAGMKKWDRAATSSGRASEAESIAFDIRALANTKEGGK